MQEFSLLKEKKVPELVLWEKYLVYATVFGISQQVLKQLKVVYPQVMNTEYMSSHDYAYMYLMYSNNFSQSFLMSLNTSISVSNLNMTNYSSNYSSGSGFGGGFSSGGGFGGGGRTEWAEGNLLKSI